MATQLLDAFHEGRRKAAKEYQQWLQEQQAPEKGTVRKTTPQKPDSKLKY